MQPINLQFKTKNDKQIEACEYWFDSVVEEIVYGGAKGGGKSFLGASLIFADALTYPETHYFIARKELNDLRKFTIPTIYEVFDKWNLKLEDYATYDGQLNCFKLFNGSKVFLLQCNEMPSDPLFERFGSMQMTRGWIEEGGEVAEAAKNNLWLSVGRWKNDVYKLKKKLLITCNPKKNWIKRDYVDKHNKNILEPSKKFVSARPTDNPYLPDGYVDTLKNQKDAVARARLYDGIWDYADDVDSFFPFDVVNDMFGATILDIHGKYMTVDVARQGSDKTVFMFWEGMKLYRVETFEKQGLDVTAMKLKEFSIMEQIPFKRIVVDEDGVGGGIVDMCRGVHGFINNSAALPLENPKYEYLEKTNFANLKTQCAYMMSELVKNHEVAISVTDNTEFREKFSEEAQTYQFRNNDEDQQKLRLISKVDQKEILGRSPDYGDAFIMRGFFLLKKEYRPITPQQERTFQLQRMIDETEYDQFEVLPR